MIGRKIYLQPMGMILDTINDIVELQKGKLTFSDTPHGKIYFMIKMYGFKWELQFSVADIGGNSSRVTLAIGGEKRNREKLIRKEFALMDAILSVGTEIEFTDSADDA